jgi:hypothetical protein
MGMVGRAVQLAFFALWCPGLKGQIFEFHSGFWVNLHQFLYQQASAPKPEPSGSAAWQQALTYYRREMTPHNLLGDDMASVNDRLSRAESAASLEGTSLDLKLRAALEGAAATYREVWWPQHNHENLAWIDAAKPLLAKYGAAMKQDIAAAFRTEWPADAIRTDVSHSAGPVGAYTTRTPTHITVSSADPGYRGPASLEMLFHEASHSLDDLVNQALSEELQAQDKLFRRRGFGHAVLFYTAGEIARRHLGEYEPYGILHGMYDAGWPESLSVLEQDWKPYLDGKTDFREAVRSLVRDYGVPKESSKLLALRMRFE